MQMISKGFFISAMAAALITTSVNADEGQFYIAPGIQWMNFNQGIDLHNDEGFSLGFGYDFTDRSSLELAFFDMEPEMSGGGDTDLTQWRLDFLYDLDFDLGPFTTFVVTGLGQNDFDFEEENVWNLGAGVKYEITDNIEWRTAARNFFSLDRKRSDIGVDTSLVFHFGNPRRAAAPVAAEPAPTQAPAPVPVVVDTDGDGVPDNADACPGTPRNYAVDNRGCPIMMDELVRAELDVVFAFDSDVVRPQFLPEIQQIAEFMREYPEVVVELEGHTDSQGPDDYNLDLSQRRADAVRDVLVEQFNIQASRVTAVGLGETQPIASNDAAAGREQNRRVITVITETLQVPQPR